MIKNSSKNRQDETDMLPVNAVRLIGLLHSEVVIAGGELSVASTISLDDRCLTITQMTLSK